MNKYEYSEIASRLGFALLVNGAETYRVEDSISRVLSALGAVNIDVFVINSCILYSMETTDGKVITDMKRCSGKGIDLYKLDKLNSLCRKICSGYSDYAGIIAEIDSIEKKQGYPFWLKLFGFVIISVGFSIIFGGRVFEGLAAAFTGFLVYPIMCGLDKLKTGLFFKNIIGSAAIVLFVLIFHAFFINIDYDKAIIGTFMNLVPGVALTTSMRDILAGDLIAGKNVLTEAIIIALGMALGAGLAISGLSFLI